jgi:chromosome segregation ATPase
MEKLSEQLRQMSLELNQKQKENQTLLHEVSDLKTINEESEKQIETLTKQNTKFAELMTSADKELVTSADKEESLEKSLTLSNEEVKKKEEVNQQLMSKLDEKVVEIANLKHDIKSK